MEKLSRRAARQAGRGEPGHVSHVAIGEAAAHDEHRAATFKEFRSPLGHDPGASAIRVCSWASERASGMMRGIYHSSGHASRLTIVRPASRDAGR